MYFIASGPRCRKLNPLVWLESHTSGLLHRVLAKREELVAYMGFYWDNYRFCKNKKQDETDSHPLDFTKYVISKKTGKVDRRTVLGTRNDVATAKWGKKWRMPTRDEMHELLEGCVWTFTEDFEGMDIAGYVGTSKQNGNTIFFPSINSLVAIWSSSLYEPACGVEACCFNFSEDGVEMSHSERSHGQNDRAVVK